MISNKITIVSVVVALVFIASVINIFDFHGEINSLSRRKLAFDNSKIFSNEEEIISQLNIKPYEVWDRSKHQFPCVNENAPKNQGIFYIKVPKTSSSTLAGITSRIAAKESRRQGFPTDKMCKTHDPMVHSSASDLDCGKRDKEKSFLWTVVRHPNDRAVSHYGMRLSFGNVKNHQKEFRDNLLGNASFKTNTQLAFMSTKKLKDYSIKDDEIAFYVQDILDEYNFVGIYERLHESLVVFSMLMDMNINDVIFNYRPIKNARCGSLEEPDWLNDGMRNYLKSAEWARKQKADFIMYKAINKKLDMTIEALGLENVQKKRADFEKLLYLGTDLSSRIRKKTGCGVIFPSVYGDIDGMKNFKELTTQEQEFVKSTLEK